MLLIDEYCCGVTGPDINPVGVSKKPTWLSIENLSEADRAAALIPGRAGQRPCVKTKKTRQSPAGFF
jgi:hypothetical protein